MFSPEQPQKKTTFNRDNFLSVKILSPSVSLSLFLSLILNSISVILQVMTQFSPHRATENYIDLDGHSHSFPADLLFSDENDGARYVWVFGIAIVMQHRRLMTSYISLERILSIRRQEGQLALRMHTVARGSLKVVA